MARLETRKDSRPVEAAFFFGTLMHRRILERVIGNDGAHLVANDANLVGYTRHHVKDADYPAVVPAEEGRKIMGHDLTDDEASVRGTVVTGLTAGDLDLLDEFEGDEYCRNVVSVNRLGEAAGSPPILAWVYLWDSSLHRLAPTLWSYDDFCKEKLSRWVQGSSEYAEVDRRRNLNGHTTPAEQLSFGHELRNAYWRFAPGWTNLNTGSYGSCPRPVVEAFRQYQDRAESAPDRWFQREQLGRLNEARARMAKIVHCEVEDLMMCPNATTGVNSIIRSLGWREDDVILYFSTIYSACLKTLRFVVDSHPQLRLKLLEVPLAYPLSDDQVIEQTRATLKANRHPGKVRLALFDTITSTPGVRMPWERLCALFREHGILSLVDGAHTVGQIPLDLAAVQPDFFVSNLHKHFFVHRACAILYVPRRLQPFVHAMPMCAALRPAWLWTCSICEPAYSGHVYAPTPADQDDPPPSTSLVDEWAWTSTQDWSAICSIPAAIEFREKLGGEQKIMQYNHDLAVRGGKLVASILGTEVMENEERTLTASMVNVRLPIRYRASPEVGVKIRSAMIDRLFDEHQTYLSIYDHNGAYWIRLTGQVFLELSDFEIGANAVLAVCEAIERDEALR